MHLMQWQEHTKCSSSSNSNPTKATNAWEGFERKNKGVRPGPCPKEPASWPAQAGARPDTFPSRPASRPAKLGVQAGATGAAARRWPASIGGARGRGAKGKHAKEGEAHPEPIGGASETRGRRNSPWNGRRRHGRGGDVGDAVEVPGAPRLDSSAWEDEEEAAEGEVASARAEDARKGGDSSSTAASLRWPPGVASSFSIRENGEGTEGVVAGSR